VHYNKISQFVKEAAAEANLPYYEYKSMRAAVIAHFKHLKDLGMKPELSA
jgi:linoleoyl-CoA desaturase